MKTTWHIRVPIAEYALCILAGILVVCTQPVSAQVTPVQELTGPFFHVETGLGGSSQNGDYERGIGFGVSGGYSGGRWAGYAGMHRVKLETDGAPSIFEYEASEYIVIQYELVGRINLPGLLEIYPNLAPYLDLGISLMRSEHDEGAIVLKGSGLVLGFGAHYFIQKQIALTAGFAASLGAYGEVSTNDLTVDLNAFGNVSDNPVYLTVGVSFYPALK